MNKARRKELDRAIAILQTIQEQFEDAKSIVSDVASEEREAFDNLPEGLQQSDQGLRAEAIADTLDNIVSDLDNVEFENLIDQLESAKE